MPGPGGADSDWRVANSEFMNHFLPISPAFLSQLSIITYFPLPTPPFWLVTEINLQVSLIVVSYLRKLCGKVADLPIGGADIYLDLKA